MVNARKLVAALACRAGGSRLYGKPLQNLEKDYTILDHLIFTLKRCPEIDQLILGISEGIENSVFTEIARRHSIPYLIGDERNVLERLVLCGRHTNASDVFRVTTESPFPDLSMLPAAWQSHLENRNDITVTDAVPEGCHFEIYRHSVLEQSEREGQPEERSEYCSAFARRRRDLFQIEVLTPVLELQRQDLRFTVDYAEDLVLCRRAWEAIGQRGSAVDLGDLVRWADANPQFTKLVEPYVDQRPLWLQNTNQAASQ